MSRKGRYAKRKEVLRQKEPSVEQQIANQPFLAVVYDDKTFVERFHALAYEDKLKAYQTLTTLAHDSNTLSESRQDAYNKINVILQSMGLKIVEHKNCYLDKDERLIIRMDFYGSIDRLEKNKRERKLSKPYLDLISNPLKKRPKTEAYDFKTAPMWPLFERFNSFRKIEKDLIHYLAKHKIDPKILSLMSARDFSDLIFLTFQKSKDDTRVFFEKPTAVRKEFVKHLVTEKGEEIAAVLRANGYKDERYITSMLNAMRRFGTSKSDKLIVTELYFTDRVLKDLKKEKINCDEFKKGDPIPQVLIDYLIDNDKGNLIVARNEQGKPIYGSQFPSFEVHHKRAISTSGDFLNAASVNYNDNLCLVLSDVHTHVLHGFDYIVDSKRDSYSRRTEFISPHVVFMAGFDKSSQIELDCQQRVVEKRRQKQDERFCVSYDECFAKLQDNQFAYLHPQKQKDNFDVNMVVAMVNRSYLHNKFWKKMKDMGNTK